MKSKTYFHLKVVALILTFILLLITSAFLISYIIFSIRVGGKSFLLGFGSDGILIFLITFPWLLLILELVLMYILERLMKQFRFGYRSPLIYLLALLVFISVGTALAMDITNVHGSILDRNKKRQLPFFGGMYDHIKRPPRELGVCKGKVVSVSQDSFVVQEDDGEPDDKSETIIAPPGMNLGTYIKEGDIVIVATKSINGQKHAYGIQKVLSTK